MNKDISISLMDSIRACENILKRKKHKKQILPSGYGRVLAAIYKNDGISQADLAKNLEIRPQSLTRVLTDMEKEELIKKDKSNEDRRNYRLYITDKGLKQRNEIMKHRKDRAEKTFACLSDKQKEELLKLLELIIENNNKGKNND